MLHSSLGGTVFGGLNLDVAGRIGQITLLNPLLTKSDTFEPNVNKFGPGDGSKIGSHFGREQHFEIAETHLPIPPYIMRN